MGGQQGHRQPREPSQSPLVILVAKEGVRSNSLYIPYLHRPSSTPSDLKLNCVEFVPPSLLLIVLIKSDGAEARLIIVQLGVWHTPYSA